jgi:mono/diheme cytochrome c family protein
MSKRKVIAAKRAKPMGFSWRSAARQPAFAAPAMAALLLIVAPAALAQDATRNPAPELSTGFAFTEASGEQLYANVCQGCHMPDGKGAVGAGAYPSLAGDQALEAAGYPVYVVVNGLHAMPPVGIMMNDAQVAAVVNYVRTHFGNDYRDAVTPENVKTVRPADMLSDIIRRRP